MSMRALWFMLFVLAPLATLAGYGGTYGIGSAGGGVTVGNAVSGGTASRLLFNDASGLVSTATPALGAALTLTGALQGTSSNWTGQAVFSGVTTDISTGTNETLTIDPNGTGTIALNSDVKMQDVDMTLTLDSTTSGNAVQINMTTADTTRMQFGASSTTIGWWRMINSGAPAVIYNQANVGAGTNVFIVGDNNSSAASVTQLMTVDGVGTLQLPNSTTIPSGDCDADSKVGRIRRYAKDANNITLCGCQKVGSTFSWAAVITGGDCT